MNNENLISTNNQIIIQDEERPDNTVITISNESKLKILDIMNGEPNEVVVNGTEKMCAILPDDLDGVTRISIASLVVFYAGLRLTLKNYYDKLVRLKKRIVQRLVNITNDDIFKKVQYQTIEEFFNNLTSMNDGEKSLNDNQKTVIGMIECCDSPTHKNIYNAVLNSDFESFEKSLDVMGINYEKASKYAWSVAKRNEIWKLYKKAANGYNEIALYVNGDFPRIMLDCDGGTITAAHLKASLCFMERLAYVANGCMENMKNYDKKALLELATQMLLEDSNSFLKSPSLKMFGYIMDEIRLFSLVKLDQERACIKTEEQSKDSCSNTYLSKNKKKSCQYCPKGICEDYVRQIVENMVKEVQAKIDDAEDFNVPRKEAAKRLGISTDTLDNWRSRGKIKAKDRGRKVFFRKSDIDDLMK